MHHNGFAFWRNSSIAAMVLFGFSPAWELSYSDDLLFNPSVVFKPNSTDTNQKRMRTAKNSQKNGVTKQAPKPVTTAVTQKPVTKEQPAKVSLEDRIHKVEELRSLTGKRQRTIDTLHQLRAFHFASDENCTLTMLDAQGHKFMTSNTNLITLLKDYFITLLDDKVSALDDEIIGFKL